MRHVLDKARFAAPGWSFEKHWQTGFVGCFENADFVADRQVIGGLMGIEMTHFGAFAASLEASVESLEFNCHVSSVSRKAVLRLLDSRRGGAGSSRTLWH